MCALKWEKTKAYPHTVVPTHNVAFYFTELSVEAVDTENLKSGEQHNETQQSESEDVIYELYEALYDVVICLGWHKDLSLQGDYRYK